MRLRYRNTFIRNGTGRVPVRRWCIGETSLSTNEASVLFAVMCRPTVSVTDLIEMLWPDPDAEPDWAATIVHVVMLHLRGKMAGSGWTIGRMASAVGARYSLKRAEEAQRLAA